MIARMLLQRESIPERDYFSFKIDILDCPFIVNS